MSQQHERLADAVRSFMDHLGPVRGFYDHPVDGEWVDQLVLLEDDVLRELEAWERENLVSTHRARR